MISSFQIAFLGALKGELDKTEIKHEVKGTGDFLDAKLISKGTNFNCFMFLFIHSFNI